MSNGPKRPSRAKCCAAIGRYLKPDQTPNWRVEIPLFYRLWEQYPDIDFWLKHELPFHLNSLAWFLTEQGQAQLRDDWTLFHYVMPEPVENPKTELDTSDQPVYVRPQSKRPQTISEFLKS